jgi:hypothetical protein
VFANLLRQRCPGEESTVADILRAFDTGCVRAMQASVGTVDEDALVDRLVDQSGMDPKRARWVIESWVYAFAGTDSAPVLGRDWAAWNRLDVKSANGGGAYQRAVGNLIVVAAAGAAGGAVVGLLLSVSGEAARMASLDTLDEAAPWLQAMAFLFLGLLGGLAGGVIGWIGFGGRSFTHDTIGGTTFGRLGFSALAAVLGAGSGVIVGLVLLGLIGVMIGALFGAVMAILIAELILRFWP